MATWPQGIFKMTVKAGIVTEKVNQIIVTIEKNALALDIEYGDDDIEI